MSEKYAMLGGRDPHVARRRHRCVALGLCAVISVFWLVPSLVALVESSSGNEVLKETSLGSRIKRQERISFLRVLENIGPPAGAKDGLVVASKSHGEVDQPDYLVRLLLRTCG